MAKVSVQDLRTFYQGCVVMIDGQPSLVTRINEDRKVQYKNLTTQLMGVILYDENRIKSPNARLGMVNINGVAVYLMRRTIRRYMMGLSQENTIAQSLKHVDYRNVGLNPDMLGNVATAEVAATLLGKFPSFKEALAQVKTFGGVVAFDRQFAINEQRIIYYKNNPVGVLPVGDVDPECILFDDEYKYLSCLLNEVTHEKIARTVGN